MTTQEKYELAIKKGYTYNSENGFIYNKKNKIIKSKDGYGYTIISITKGVIKFNIKAHQFGWYYFYKECVKEIDHINSIRDDNRICNLRAVTRQQNQFNRTNVKGYSVYKYKNSTYYKARIILNSKEIYLGLFTTEQEARKAYLDAKKKYHII